MPYIPNIIERTLALLAGQFQGGTANGDKTNLQKLISALAESVQDVENVIQQLRTGRNLDSAEGVQLDGIGEILDLPRLDDETDENYRERLKFQSFINGATGTPEEVIAIFKFLTNAEKVRYIEYYPAAFQMITDGTTFPSPASDLIEAIQRASPAGVQYTPVTANYGEFPFVFGADSEIELLYVTNPSDPSELVNLELDTADLLYVNASTSASNPEGGGFAEYGSPDIDITGAGMLAEVIYI